MIISSRTKRLGRNFAFSHFSIPVLRTEGRRFHRIASNNAFCVSILSKPPHRSQDRSNLGSLKLLTYNGSRWSGRSTAILLPAFFLLLPLRHFKRSRPTSPIFPQLNAVFFFSNYYLRILSPTRFFPHKSFVK